MRAFLDESVRVAEPGMYVLAATVVLDHQLEATRRAIVDALPVGMARFHWRNEREPVRMKLCGALIDAGLTHHVAVCAPLDRRRDERARRRCLTSLTWTLYDEGVTHLHIETRHQRDASDRTFLGTEQRVRRIPPRLSYSFDQPAGDPLLWAADAAAGAVAWGLGAAEPQYLDAFGRSLKIVQLPGIV